MFFTAKQAENNLWKNDFLLSVRSRESGQGKDKFGMCIDQFIGGSFSFQNVLAGALFGQWTGFVLACLLSAMGATMCYLLSMLCGKHYIQRYFPDKLLFMQKKVWKFGTSNCVLWKVEWRSCHQNIVRVQHLVCVTDWGEYRQLVFLPAVSTVVSDDAKLVSQHIIAHTQCANSPLLSISPSWWVRNEQFWQADVVVGACVVYMSEAPVVML